jgi:hypothetical protein
MHVLRQAGVGSRLVIGGGLLMLAAAQVVGAAPSEAQEPPAAVSIEARPRWGQSPAGAWSSYVVDVANDGVKNLDAEVVLEPRPPLETDRVRPVPVEVFEPERPEQPARSPVAPPLEGGPPAPVWPVHRTQVTVAAGGKKTLGMVVLEAPYGYRASLRDETGRVLAMQPGATGPPAQRTGAVISVLGRTAPGDVLVTGAPEHPLLTELSVTRLEDGREFPHDPLQLSGLQVVVLADLDTTSLRSTQIQALQSFVGLGGSLVLSGGATAQRRLAGLPDRLVPMRPSATASGSLGGLGAGGATASATLATGIIGFGRATVATAGEPPLVVEGDYGLGHVVQLTFDPFAGPFASDLSLGALGVEAGLAPALASLATSSASVPEHLWEPVADGRDREGEGRPWPRWGLAALGGYVLLLGPACYLLLRSRGRRDATWRCIPVAALVLTGIGAVTVPPARDAPDALENVVEVETIGPDGRVMVSTYHGLLEPNGAQDEHLALRASPGAAVSSVIARPADRRAPPGMDLSIGAFAESRAMSRLSSAERRARVVSGTAPAGAADVVLEGDGAQVLRTAPNDAGRVTTMQTIAIRLRDGGIESDLRVTGSRATENWRVSGTLTNRTGDRLRSPSIRIDEPGSDHVGWARAGVALEPGGMLRVDASVQAGLDSGTDRAGRSRDLRVMSAAADTVGHQKGRPVVVALTDSDPSPSGSPLRGTSLRVVLQPGTAPA